jgi:hypothetical protein
MLHYTSMGAFTVRSTFDGDTLQGSVTVEPMPDIPDAEAIQRVIGREAVNHTVRGVLNGQTAEFRIDNTDPGEVHECTNLAALVLRLRMHDVVVEGSNPTSEAS